MDITGGFIQKGQDRLGAFLEQLAGGGDLQMPFVTPEKGSSKLVLQRFELKAERRLRNIQALGGTGDIAQSRDLQKVLQLF